MTLVVARSDSSSSLVVLVSAEEKTFRLSGRDEFLAKCQVVDEVASAAL